MGERKREREREKGGGGNVILACQVKNFTIRCNEYKLADMNTFSCVGTKLKNRGRQTQS